MFQVEGDLERLGKTALSRVLGNAEAVISDDIVWKAAEHVHLCAAETRSSLHDLHQTAFLYGILYLQNKSQFLLLLHATMMDNFECAWRLLNTLVLAPRMLHSPECFESILWLLSKWVVANRHGSVPPELEKICAGLFGQLAFFVPNNRDLGRERLCKYASWIADHVTAFSRSSLFAALFIEHPEILDRILDREAPFAFQCELTAKLLESALPQATEHFVFMLEKVPPGNAHRYQQWFYDRVLVHFPSLATEWIRYLCLYHTCSMSKRVNMADWLLSTLLPGDQHRPDLEKWLEDAKKAIYHDWTKDNPDPDNLLLGWHMLFSSTFRTALFQFLLSMPRTSGILARRKIASGLVANTPGHPTINELLDLYPDASTLFTDE